MTSQWKKFSGNKTFAQSTRLRILRNRPYPLRRLKHVYESGLVNSFTVFSSLLHNQWIRIAKNFICYKSFTIKKGGPLGPVEGASAPVVPPSLRACTLTNPSTSFWNGVACSFNSVFGIQWTLFIFSLRWRMPEWLKIIKVIAAKMETRRWTFLPLENAIPVTWPYQRGNNTCF